MVRTGDLECRPLLAEIDLQLLGGLLEQRRIFRNQIEPGLALANRVAPDGDEIHARFLQGGEQVRAFARLVGNHY